MFVWNERKREINLIKHGYDFADADIVYDDPFKRTFVSIRTGEPRNADTTFVEPLGYFLTLVYVCRGDDIRIIFFRRASKKERRLYQEPPSKPD